MASVHLTFGNRTSKAKDAQNGLEHSFLPSRAYVANSELSMLTSWLTCSQFIAFSIGWMKQDIVLAVYLGAAGTALAFVAVVPSWPFYNKDPVKWLPVGSGLTVG